jgi:Right handed beta helix region
MITAAATLLVAGLVPVGAAQVAHADTAGPITFESPGFSTGSINGQNGWSSTGPYDQGVVASSRFASFGAQSLRISSAVTSGSFGDQTFSPPLASPAGELPLLPHFDATLQVGTTQDGVQPGLHLSVSPDNGSGARMSYLRLEDQGDGVHVFFDDVVDPGPVGTAATFNETDIATLDRTSAHTLRFSIDFFTGPGNDVVKIFIDGALRTAGTTWENYYRYDPEAAGGGNALSPTSSLLLRESGTAAPATVEAGFLVDNVSLASSSTTSACAFSTSGAVMTLLADCTTDTSILVPAGYTLDGAGHTITAVDPPAPAHFTGAVVANAGASASVRNLGVTTDHLATVCDAFPASLAGIRLDGASGTITATTVTGLQQGSVGDGCQEGNAIEVRNTDGGPTPAVSVTGNTARSYQKTGVLVKGAVSAVVTGNTITGYGPVDFIAQNGIQVSFGATALVADNTISDNFYTPKSVEACGLLIYQAGGVKVDKNTFSGNEKNLCNISRGGTFGGL